MTQPSNNQDDEFQQLLRRIEGQTPNRQPPDEPDPIFGEAQPIPQQRQYRLSLPLAMPRAVWVLLVVNIVIFAVPALLDTLGLRILGLRPSQFVSLLGAKDNEAIKIDGQYYRLLTAMFLHGGLLHIVFNSYALYSLGPEAERIYGTPRFLALYFISGLAGSVASYALVPNRGVGASGAIFGLIGGLAVFYYIARQMLGEISRQMLGSLITVIMINLFIGFSTPSIDNMAHIGGLVGGALVGFLLAPRFELNEQLYPPVITRGSLPLGWAWTLGVLGLLVALAMVINPAGVAP